MNPFTPLRTIAASTFFLGTIAATAVSHKVPTVIQKAERLLQPTASLELAASKTKKLLLQDTFIPQAKGLFQEKTATGKVRLSTEKFELSVPCGITKEKKTYETIGLITVDREKPSSQTTHKAGALCATLAVEAFKDKLSTNQPIESYLPAYALGAQPKRKHKTTFNEVSRSGIIQKPRVEDAHDDRGFAVAPSLTPTPATIITTSDGRTLLKANNNQSSFACVQGLFTNKDTATFQHNNPTPIRNFQTVGLYAPFTKLEGNAREDFIAAALEDCEKRTKPLTKNLQAIGIVPEAYMHPSKGATSQPALTYSVLKIPSQKKFYKR